MTISPEDSEFMLILLKAWLKYYDQEGSSDGLKERTEFIVKKLAGGNTNTNPPAVESWQGESDFWHQRARRAFIRCEIARENGDDKASRIALREGQLYNRRMKAVIPKSVKKEWDEERRLERQFAMKEKE